MTYRITKGWREVVVFRTWNGRVTDAPRAWDWVVGKPATEVLNWCLRHGLSWTLIGP